MMGISSRDLESNELKFRTSGGNKAVDKGTPPHATVSISIPFYNLWNASLGAFRTSLQDLLIFLPVQSPVREARFSSLLFITSLASIIQRPCIYSLSEGSGVWILCKQLQVQREI